MAPVGKLELERQGLLSKPTSPDVLSFSSTPTLVRRRRERRLFFLVSFFTLVLGFVLVVVVSAISHRSGGSGSTTGMTADPTALAVSSSGGSDKATFGPAGWAVKKLTHVCKAGTANDTFSFLTSYLMHEVEPASNLGCGSTRIKLSARVPWNSTLQSFALQFVDAPVFNDLTVGETQGADWWVQYWQELHGNLTTFDAWMHNKVVLFTPDLAAFVGPLLRDNVPVLVRSSMDKDGAAVGHVAVQVQGVLFELVGPQSTLPSALQGRARVWSEDECPAAHSLPRLTSLADLSALVTAAAASEDTELELRPGLPRLVLVTTSMTTAEPLGAAAKTQYAHAYRMTGLSATVTHADDGCTVVDSAWSESPGLAIRRVRNDAAPSGDKKLADFDAFMRTEHATFVEGHSGSWDRFLDQHLGVWYSGEDIGACNARAAALREMTHADSVPTAERAQSDAHLFYAGYDGPIAWEYQFANCDADRPSAPEECGCVASNNYGDFFNATGRDSCTGSAQPETWIS